MIPPTFQTLTYSTGAAFLVGRSAACALATATMLAAEPSRRLLMSVICDLQLDLVGVGFLLNFDIPGLPTDRMKSKLISPLFPFDLSIVALAPATRFRPKRAAIPFLSADQRLNRENEPLWTRCGRALAARGLE